MGRLALATAGIVHELLEDGFDLVEVRFGGHHKAVVAVVGNRHGHRQPQFGERRADVVRDAGQHHRARRFGLLQRLRHLIEGATHLGDFCGAVGR